MTTQDWEAFVPLATVRHRATPSVARHLDILDMPDSARARIIAAARRNSLAALTHMAETRRIAQALDAIDVQIGVFKGWPLAELLHGEIDARQAGDLDLLVPEYQVKESRIALEEIGFEILGDTPKDTRRLRRLDGAQLIRTRKDFKMMRPTTGVLVEMHWRLLNYHGWPILLDRPGALITQDSSAGPLLVPNDQTNMLYLSTHGALHLWEQLKWLEDIAWLARKRGAEGLVADVEAASAVGLERPILFALLLAGQLLASPIPPGLEHDDPRVAGLVKWILRRMPSQHGRFERKRRQVGVRWMGLLLAQDWRQRLGIIGYDTARRFRLMSLDAQGATRKR